MVSGWRILAVVDGDTFHVEGTVRFDVAEAFPGLTLEAAVVVREKIRLAHCNAPERFTPEGKAAKAAVTEWLGDGSRLAMIGRGRDKYGRWLADVTRDDGQLLSAFVLGLQGSVPMELHLQMGAP